jgi:hypothetical protein
LDVDVFRKRAIHRSRFANLHQEFARTSVLEAAADGGASLFLLVLLFWPLADAATGWQPRPPS